MIDDLALTQPVSISKQAQMCAKMNWQGSIVDGKAGKRPGTLLHTILASSAMKYPSISIHSRTTWLFPLYPMNR
jgi:hypothetical protein